MFFLLAATWICLITAIARPVKIGEPIALPTTGRDILMAVDISGSMEREDMIINGRQVNRLFAVKSVVGDFVSTRLGDRLGLILFGERAYLQTPLTFDKKTLQKLLTQAQIGFAGNGTAIDFITIMTTGNSLDFGDATQSLVATSACSNATRGVLKERGSSYTNAMSFLTIATLGNMIDFGDAPNLTGKPATNACLLYTSDAADE